MPALGGASGTNRNQSNHLAKPQPAQLCGQHRGRAHLAREQNHHCGPGARARCWPHGLRQAAAVLGCKPPSFKATARPRGGRNSAFQKFRCVLRRRHWQVRIVPLGKPPNETEIVGLGTERPPSGQKMLCTTQHSVKELSPHVAQRRTTPAPTQSGTAAPAPDLARSVRHKDHAQHRASKSQAASRAAIGEESAMGKQRSSIEQELAYQNFLANGCSRCKMLT